MKQIFILFLFFLISSCASHRTVQQEKVKEKISIDSTFNHVLTNKNIEIEWIFTDDTAAIPFLPGKNDTAAKPSRKYSPQKIPRCGKIRIHITNDSIVSKGEVKATAKKKAKTKKKEPAKVLKPQKAKNHFNFIYVIIFGFCVKYLWEHKKSLKKIWNLIK